MERQLRQRLDQLYREQTGPTLAYLSHLLGSFAQAEEVWHDTLAAALEHWPREMPVNPPAWLRLTAKRKAIDKLRQRRLTLEKSRVLQALAGQVNPLVELDFSAISDDLLKLIFSCCHPAIAFENRLALTLYAVCGLTTTQIAEALLLSKATLEQRLTRAKQKLKSTGIALDMPDDKHLEERLEAVMKVVYLMFNAGFNQERQVDSNIVDLCQEAIGLANCICQLMSNKAEPKGLLALMLFSLARRPARMQGKEIVLLEHQNRGLWDKDMANEADQLLAKAFKIKAIGSYQLQAAIAGVHHLAESFEHTDWPQIYHLYQLLMRIDHNPVIQINAAVAQAMTGDIDGGLAALEALEEIKELQSYASLFAAKADLHRRLNNRTKARDNYQQALQLTDSEGEKQVYRQQLERLTPRG